ncbi:hypothetical protein BN946_scf184579.g8 [Trametes cinnabarina]|uniref:Cytochrome P450 n=1 Tax=Pycnoporus cinnabarinus TaxID=5643 RepID=A0A060S7S2_PYCCI|nr:hypothetical protein BN946_scf184579.g8 [Trametes cinnabarina]
MQIMKDGLEYTLGLFERYGGVVKVYGVLGVEQLFLHDPLALQHILVKDQDAFEETDMFIETNKLLFGEGLIATLGEQHKKQRRMLNPVFSLANLRRVLPRIQPIANEVVERLRDTLPKDGGPREIDLLPWIKKATIEYVARGIIGVSLDSLEPTEASEYTNAICSVSQVAMRVVFIRPLIPWVVRNISLYLRNKLVDWLPLPALRELRCLSEVMEKSSREAYLAKKAEVNQSGGSDRSYGDLMSIMLRANASSLEKSQLTETELIGQINTFVLAGQETSTSTLGRLLHVLAREQDAQKRLRSEVRDAKTRHALACGMEASEWESVSLPYDILTGLPYLDAVVRETLRLHPPTSIMNRVYVLVNHCSSRSLLTAPSQLYSATKDSVLPLQYPICSATGEQVSTVYVPKGTNVMISILGANRDKHVWGQDADEWRPERWLTASYEGINATSPGARIVSEFGEESVASSVDEQGSSNKDRADIRYPGVFGSM